MGVRNPRGEIPQMLNGCVFFFLGCDLHALFQLINMGGAGNKPPDSSTRFYASNNLDFSFGENPGAGDKLVVVQIVAGLHLL